MRQVFSNCNTNSMRWAWIRLLRKTGSKSRLEAQQKLGAVDMSPLIDGVWHGGVESFRPDNRG